ncbi:MAG: orotate phosphoribosyltransferase [Alphaproteobacteria bacterium]
MVIKSTIEKKLSKKAANILLDLKCINFSPKKQFKLTSGKKSPVYCDCRRIISFPRECKELIDFGVKKIGHKINLSEITNVAGGESAGIPFAALIANRLKMPMTYIRKERKKFGKNSQIEGIMSRRDKVLLVEDLMTDGGSKLNFLNAIYQEKAIITGIFVIFNYGIINDFFSFKKKKIDIIFLTSWKFILESAFEKKILDLKEIQLIEKFLFDIGVKN